MSYEGIHTRLSPEVLATLKALTAICIECHGTGWSKHVNSSGQEWLGECWTCMQRRRDAGILRDKAT